MSTPESREHLRRLKIRHAALKRHAAARDPLTGKSTLAVAAGRASATQREGDQVWGLGMSLKRWYPEKAVVKEERDRRHSAKKSTAAMSIPETVPNRGETFD